jgi:hypothetical protein
MPVGSGGVRNGRSDTKKHLEDLRTLFQQAKVLDSLKASSCMDCPVFRENPRDFAEQMICPKCACSEKITDPELLKLLHYFRIQSAGCVLGRHELTDFEWLALGRIKTQWEKLTFENAQNRPRNF